MRLHLGYVPLCDAAPLLAAAEMGFGREEGLDLDLSAEPSWATLRDRLALGYLDAAHMLAPLALASAVGLSGPPADLAVPLGLSLNGNAVTLSKPLWDAMAPPDDGLESVAQSLARVARERRAQGRPLTLGTVHPFSSHTYQLRHLLLRGGLDLAAIRLVAVPPQHSVETLARGLVDGFCAGAPWNGVAVAAGIGRIAALGCEIVPDCPEKVLALSGRLGEAALPLVRAVARAGLWCGHEANRVELAHRLARRSALGQEAGLIARCLEGEIIVDSAGRRRRAPDYIRLGAPAQRPGREQARWLFAEMAAAGQVPSGPDLREAVEAIYRPDLFEAAGPVA
ncbi:CmpA/NrtA family ABC transporter substrate-binding protein [Methylobacterium soli]|uniref:ABC transporter substrate-binding protein n=1 Tax=Methylobacterium soli TaxID=553447 RepID=A0A6L3SZE0_9HYPH|nr:CmpA/NrtA family ABC transporter substrate-binding protein [Methylobacterium soli]KAB1077718.1 ABC transporter substrate-binding protein [Methylobacterium soli]GJE44813.1 Bicarbonate transport ATP-binding protein CmpC [Methylobacterium soli]